MNSCPHFGFWCCFFQLPQLFWNCTCLNAATAYRIKLASNQVLILRVSVSVSVSVVSIILVSYRSSRRFSPMHVGWVLGKGHARAHFIAHFSQHSINLKTFRENVVNYPMQYSWNLMAVICTVVPGSWKEQILCWMSFWSTMHSSKILPAANTCSAQAEIFVTKLNSRRSGSKIYWT